MIQRNLIDSKLIKNRNLLYFVHYDSDIYIIEEEEEDPFMEFYMNNEETLKKNDWELHKKYVKEGVNLNEVAKIIQNDEIEKLQEISAQKDFDYNQIIKPSIYERCSFINEENVSLIDYAAYFSAIKCFKYLLMNNAKVNNTGKYAIAGGNLEIVHLCEQNHSSFENAYETAIEFHRNDIFHYFYDNKIIEVQNIEKLGKKCIVCHNYEIFSFLIKEGLKIREDIINVTAKIGNLYLVKYFLQNNQIPNNILLFSSESGNFELVQYILEQKGIDINAKDINM